MDLENPGCLGFLLLVLAFFGVARSAPRAPAPVPIRVHAEPAEVLHFGLGLDAAIAAGLLPPDVDRADLLRRTLDIAADRLARAGIRVVYLRARGDDAFDVALGADVDSAEVERLLALRGDVLFRVEVRPAARYPHWQRDVVAPRRGDAERPWPGTEDEFDAFLGREVLRWKEAHAAGRPYVPSEPGYVLAPRAGGAAAAPGDFVLLESAGPGEGLDGSMLRAPVVSLDPAGRPVVAFEVQSAAREAFAAWTGRNLGLPVAILLDGEVLSAPVIQDVLKDHVQISLGAAAGGEAEAEARRLALALESGTLPVAPRLLGVEVTASDAQLPAPGSGSMLRGAQVARARAGLEAIRIAAQQFEVTNGLPPRSLAELTRAAFGGPFLAEAPVDPWGRPYEFLRGGPGGSGYRIRSLGPDGVADTEDDLWARE